MSKITLEAISDPEVRVSGELFLEYSNRWEIQLSPHVTANVFEKDGWRIAPPTLPTEPGTVFRATVDGEPNVRVVTVNKDSAFPFLRISGRYFRAWASREDIDASTIVIELEGVGDER